MREAASGVSSSTTDVISNQETNLEKPPSTTARVSEQQQVPVVPTKDIVNRASPYQRSSLNKATAKPVTHWNHSVPPLRVPKPMVLAKYLLILTKRITRYLRNQD